MNLIKATSLALALAVLIGNAASAQPPDFKAMRDRFEARWDRSEARFKAMRDRFEARMDQKYRILEKQAEGEYQRNIAEANKLRAEANKLRDAAPNYTPVPKADVRQAQRTCTTTCSPCFYRGCVPSCTTVCN